MCEYCEERVPFQGMYNVEDRLIVFRNRLEFSPKQGANGFCSHIRYCPMCGRDLCNYMPLEDRGFEKNECGENYDVFVRAFMMDGRFRTESVLFDKKNKNISINMDSISAEEWRAINQYCKINGWKY